MHYLSLGTMIRDLTLPILSFFTGISFSQASRHQRQFCIFYSLVMPVFSYWSLVLTLFTQAVRQALGGSSSIEDLLIPFFCISTNLSQLDQEVHSSFDTFNAQQLLPESRDMNCASLLGS